MLRRIQNAQRFRSDDFRYRLLKVTVLYIAGDLHYTLFNQVLQLVTFAGGESVLIPLFLLRTVDGSDSRALYDNLGCLLVCLALF